MVIILMTMSQLNVRRARSPKAKSARRSQILDAARRLAEAGADPETISMAEVARMAGVAKGTPYLYFRTKEELFVGLLETGLDDWFDEMDAGLSTGSGWMPAAGLADLLAESLARRPLLRRLLALLGPVLERNLDTDRALRFKWRVAGRLATTGSLLERRTVFLRRDDGPRLLLRLLGLAMGIQTLAEPAAGVRGVLAAPGLEVFRLDFAGDFRAAAGAWLTGLERTN
jgi:AcrR family transcriptional regulator